MSKSSTPKRDNGRVYHHSVGLQVDFIAFFLVSAQPWRGETQITSAFATLPLSVFALKVSAWICRNRKRLTVAPAATLFSRRSLWDACWLVLSQ